MPKRTDIQSILVIGAGPIVIGQACEFDYSGSQACKALMQEGYRVILVNSNPATIMTDPEMADKTYIEPVTPDVIQEIIIREKPDALLPTIGGQTGLNAAVKVAENNFLEQHGVEIIGADINAINKAENRELFKKTMEQIGLRTTKAKIARSTSEAVKIAKEIGFPLIIRASFTLGGTGGSIAYNMEEFKGLATKGLEFSLANEIIVEESIVGWKEYELEVMRDQKDNVVIICSIENVDPIGFHTGDSITVAPQQTLTDSQYQTLRDHSIKIIREIGVSTGGANVQFAIHPKTGEVIVIEMNPRVSRSSALASKATGFPIAKIAAKLAVGYYLDEIPNDITRYTPASFEPTIDYVVTKIPRFAFEKFSVSDPTLGVQMKSVGETMSIGRTFNESFQKAIRGLEIGSPGFDGFYFSYANIIKKKNQAQNQAQKLIETIIELEFEIQRIYSKNMTKNGTHLYRRINGLPIRIPMFLNELISYRYNSKLLAKRSRKRRPTNSNLRKCLKFIGSCPEVYLSEPWKESLVNILDHLSFDEISLKLMKGEWEKTIQEEWEKTIQDKIKVEQLKKLTEFLLELELEVYKYKNNISGKNEYRKNIINGIPTRVPLIRNRKARVFESKLITIIVKRTQSINFSVDFFEYLQDLRCQLPESIRNIALGVVFGLHPDSQSLMEDGDGELKSSSVIKLYQILSKLFSNNDLNEISFDEVFLRLKEKWEVISPFFMPSLYDQEELEKIKKDVRTKLKSGHYERLKYLKDAFFLGIGQEEIFDLTKMDPWFIEHLFQIFNLEKKYWGRKLNDIDATEFKLLKSNGFSDEQLSFFFHASATKVKKKRKSLKIKPVYKLVDTCSAEFKARTPYYYSSYDEEDEIKKKNKKKIVILGGGPNRIGQGIEFDYMCVQASLMLRELGFETIMINSNPETVSTDYDISTHLFFEPVTFEDVTSIVDKLKPKGVIVQLGGQTPLNIVKRLEKVGVKILGTSAENIFKAEDRDLFKNIIDSLGFKQPRNAIAYSTKESLHLGETIGYPLVVRPSFVLGGRAMRIVHQRQDLEVYLEKAVEASKDKPILLDHYLEGAVEVDVDCIFDGEDFKVCGIVEHIEEAGIHSGDSACVFPAQHLSQSMIKKITFQSREIAKVLNVIGLMNVQFAVQKEELYFLEVNPRGSRTVPFISKASGVPWVKIATAVMVGKKLKDIPLEEKKLNYICVKEAILPFDKFPHEDTILGPEMKSTGEVMGIGKNLGQAFAKAQMAVGQHLPSSGGVLITLNTKDKPKITNACHTLKELGFLLFATEGTHRYLKEQGIEAKFIHKLGKGRPDVRDLILNKEVNMIFNTPVGREAKVKDEYLRKLASQKKIPIMTTVRAMDTSVMAIKTLSKGKLGVKSIQEYHDLRG